MVFCQSVILDGTCVTLNSKWHDERGSVGVELRYDENIFSYPRYGRYIYHMRTDKIVMNLLENAS